MQTKNNFAYAKSHKITGWGCRFDSLTELKYAISIIDDYEFIRERVVIFYNPANREPTELLQSNYRYYIPDFLIRHKLTGEAFLVEIKPRAFEGQRQLDIRKEVAEKYIRWKNRDWKYKVVYDDQIILNEEQLEAFLECRKLRNKGNFKHWMDQYCRRLGIELPTILKNASPEARIRFIMFGHSLQPGGWQNSIRLNNTNLLQEMNK